MEDYGTMPCWTGQINRRILPEGDDSKGGRPKHVICKKDNQVKKYQSIRQCIKQTGWSRKNILSGEKDGWRIVLEETEME
jgi:hypothetical protein